VNAKHIRRARYADGYAISITISISRRADCGATTYASSHAPKRAVPPSARAAGAVGLMQCWAARGPGYGVFLNTNGRQIFVVTVI